MIRNCKVNDCRKRDLVAALQALHDWYVDYAKINNLFNADGSPATFHELLEARRLLTEVITPE